MQTIPAIDHKAYQRKTRTMSMDSLLYVIQDCKEAIAANPDNPKNGVYADEINYCAMELKRRRNGGR